MCLYSSHSAVCICITRRKHHCWGSDINFSPHRVWQSIIVQLLGSLCFKQHPLYNLPEHNSHVFQIEMRDIQEESMTWGVTETDWQINENSTDDVWWSQRVWKQIFSLTLELRVGACRLKSLNEDRLKSLCLTTSHVRMYKPHQHVVAQRRLCWILSSVLCCYLPACGLSGVSNPRCTHRMCIFEVFLCQGRTAAGSVFCIWQQPFSINSRPWMCAAKASHVDSCLGRCCNWHIYRQRSHAQSQIMGPAHQLKTNSNRICSLLSTCCLSHSHITNHLERSTFANACKTWPIPWLWC